MRLSRLRTVWLSADCEERGRCARDRDRPVEDRRAGRSIPRPSAGAGRPPARSTYAAKVGGGAVRARSGRTPFAVRQISLPRTMPRLCEAAAKMPDGELAAGIAASLIGCAPASVSRSTTGTAHYVFDVAFADRPPSVVRIGGASARAPMKGGAISFETSSARGVPLPAILADDVEAVPVDRHGAGIRCRLSTRRPSLRLRPQAGRGDAPVDCTLSQPMPPFPGEGRAPSVDGTPCPSATSAPRLLLASTGDSCISRRCAGWTPHSPHDPTTLDDIPAWPSCGASQQKGSCDVDDG